MCRHSRISASRSGRVAEVEPVDTMAIDLEQQGEMWLLSIMHAGLVRVSQVGASASHRENSLAFGMSEEEVNWREVALSDTTC